MRRLLIALVSLAAAGLLAELVLRVVEERTPGEIAAEWRSIIENMGAASAVERDGEDGFAQNFGKRVPHPYTAFDLKNSAKRMAQDAERFTSGSLDGSFVVMITGGSVAGLFGKHGSERLVSLVTESGVTQGEPVTVLNYGRSAFKQPQQLSLLGFVYCLGFAPDLVINLDGFNEATMGPVNAQAGVHPAYPNAAFWAHLVSGRVQDDETRGLMAELWHMRAQIGREVEAALDADVQASGFRRMRFEQRLNNMHGRWVSAQDTYVSVLEEADALAGMRGPALDGAGTPGLAVDVWARASRSMQGLCASNGARYLQVLQPTLHDPESGKHPTTAEQQFLEMGSDSGDFHIAAAYHDLRSRGAELQSSGVPFLDATRVFEGVQETLYTDFCHFNEAGNLLLADLVARRIIAELGG